MQSFFKLGTEKKLKYKFFHGRKFDKISEAKKVEPKLKYHIN